ncbi:MAG: sugar phosphate isomerase/epimerase [Chloroflexi bacterium]|nr:sugar phosphate isomerase/epimerase [Chloroflexota bacterium]MBT4072159.1 sugar phosphate isomerase/epimerase [Chloroflexota bacterium]MBT4516151.1 sugar phosphate isomerase/epimerase [Chloroflexota bacterium]MBT6682876.1 sugar phosphate isomerase/epimerase [Chloroflexota bacterium]
MIDISVATSSIDHQDSARYAVEWAIEHGFDGVEFNAPDIRLGDLSPDDREFLLAAVDEHGLRYTHHFPTSALPGSHVRETRESVFADFISEIRTAGELGIEAIVVHPGKLDVPGLAPEETSEADRAASNSYLVDFMKEAGQEAERAGVVIGLENMHYNPGWLIRAHSDLVAVVDEIGSPAVGITFDVGHAWGSGGVDAGIEAFGDRIRHVQVHDARGPEGAGNVRDQHMEVGTGVLDFQSVGEFVKPNGFVVALETSGRLADREDAVVRSRDVLRGLWD